MSIFRLRDELYVQLCRQTTENPSRDSLIRGWELLAVCLSFIPPSPTFQPALLGYMNRHRDQQFSAAFQEINKWPTHVQISHYATIACRRLDRIGSAGKKQAKKPTEDEINHARVCMPFTLWLRDILIIVWLGPQEQIFRDSMFGNTIQEVMELQKQRFPDRKLPWVQVTLSKQVSPSNALACLPALLRYDYHCIGPEVEWIPNWRNISCASWCRGGSCIQKSAWQMGMARRYRNNGWVFAWFLKLNGCNNLFFLLW